MKRRDFLYGTIFGGVSGAIIAAPDKFERYLDTLGKPEEPLEQRAITVDYETLRNNISEYEGDLVTFAPASIIEANLEGEGRWTIVFDVKPGIEKQMVECDHGGDRLDESLDYRIYAVVRGLTRLRLGEEVPELDLKEVREYDESTPEPVETPSPTPDGDRDVSV